MEECVTTWKSIPCFSLISIASNVFIFSSQTDFFFFFLENDKKQQQQKYCRIVVYYDTLPRLFPYTFFVGQLTTLVLPQILYVATVSPSVTGHLKHWQRSCNFLFADKSHWLLSASFDNPRTKVQDKNIQCNTDSLKFISTVSVGVAGQWSWARGPQ